MFQCIWLYFNFFSEQNYRISSAILSCFGFIYLIRVSLNKYKPKKVWQLKALIEKQIKRYGYNCDLNHIDVSRMKDMSNLFFNSPFNGDISQWDVSNVEDMDSMFNDSTFNGDISNWNTSNVKKMSFMFAHSIFNQDISKWNVSNVTDMDFMFYESNFEGNLNEWQVDNLDNIRNMFAHSKFNDKISQRFVIQGKEVLLPLPYWAEYEDKVSRKNAVINKSLNKELTSELKMNELETKVKKTKL
jgi:hypothetical protein